MATDLDKVNNFTVSHNTAIKSSYVDGAPPAGETDSIPRASRSSRVKEVPCSGILGWVRRTRLLLRVSWRLSYVSNTYSLIPRSGFERHQQVKLWPQLLPQWRSLTCDSTILPDIESIFWQHPCHRIHTLACREVNSRSRPGCTSVPTWSKTWKELELVSVHRAIQVSGFVCACRSCAFRPLYRWKNYLSAWTLRSLSDGLNVSLTWYFAIAFHFPEFSLTM